MTNVVLWAPLAFGLVAAIGPKRFSGYVAAVGALVTLGLTVALVASYDTSARGLQQVTDLTWIADLGIHYRVGIDALSVYLVLLTAIAWAAAAIWSATREWATPGVYALMLLLAETATLGSFFADDLLLFVLFFDLMLIPFYFMVGIWGTGPGRVAATTKMIIYTLVGSLLMLVGAVATGVLSDGNTSFVISDLAAHPLAAGSQHWIFWLFTLAFLIKMAAVPLHGWMPDAYRACPLPVLALLSGVLSKVAAYGFLQVAYPLFPDSIRQFQEVLLIAAVISILYGSALAFTQTNMRLIAGYSSVAQLGFITLGIFALSPEGDGVRGAVLQMVNHGLVVVPLFLIIAVIARRTGTEDIREMGGMATRAPVLAALFLIVTMATLAIPGSANFIGEFTILLAVFKTKLAFAVVASAGVALAAFYSLRMYQGTMHNRLPGELPSREISLREAIAIVPVVGCIIALAIYPRLIFKPFDAAPLKPPAATQAAAPATAVAGASAPGQAHATRESGGR